MAVRGVAVLFPVNVLSNNFTSLSYAAPAGVSNHYVAGLTPNAKYAVTVQTQAGQWLVTVAPGTRATADNAGLLAFDNAAQPLDDATPRWLSISLADQDVSSPVRAGHCCRIRCKLARTWMRPIGPRSARRRRTVAGPFHYTDSPPSNSGPRYYRLAR